MIGCPVLFADKPGKVRNSIVIMEVNRHQDLSQLRCWTDSKSRAQVLPIFAGNLQSVKAVIPFGHGHTFQMDVQ